MDWGPGLWNPLSSPDCFGRGSESIRTRGNQVEWKRSKQGIFCLQRSGERRPATKGPASQPPPGYEEHNQYYRGCCEDT